MKSSVVPCSEIFDRGGESTRRTAIGLKNIPGARVLQALPVFPREAHVINMSQHDEDLRDEGTDRRSTARSF